MINHPIWDIVQGTCDCQELDQLVTEDSHVLTLVQDSWTPLHFACDNPVIGEHLDTLEKMVQVGKQLHVLSIQDEAGWTPFHLLCKNKSQELTSAISIVLRHASQPKALMQHQTSDSFKTPLHFLCENQTIRSETLEQVFAIGEQHMPLDLSLCDEDGNTALHILCSNETTALNTVTLNLFLQRLGGLPLNLTNQFSTTAFHYLCQNSQVELNLVQSMLQAKADPNVPDNIGSTPCHYLCANEQLTLLMLTSMVSEHHADLLVTNSLSKRPFDHVKERHQDDQDLINFIMKFAPHERTNVSFKPPLSLHDRVGGEDLLSLADVPQVQQYVKDWNATLPPMDMNFYTAICCDPAFGTHYGQVQQQSLDLSSDPTNSERLDRWQAQMHTWRKQVLICFSAVFDPAIWSTQASTFQRPIPADLTELQSRLEKLWQTFPHHDRRQERLKAIETWMT